VIHTGERTIRLSVYNRTGGEWGTLARSARNSSDPSWGSMSDVRWHTGWVADRSSGWPLFGVESGRDERNWVKVSLYRWRNCERMSRPIVVLVIFSALLCLL
jgi:hypothetical protein